MLFDYVVALSAPSLAPHLIAFAVLAVIALAIAVTASLVLVLRVLRTSPVALACVVALETSRRIATRFFSDARARAPSLTGEFIRA